MLLACHSLTQLRHGAARLASTAGWLRPRGSSGAAIAWISINPIARRSEAIPAQLPDIPPALARMKGELKQAMKRKEVEKLSVLRAVLTETTEASKTDSPVRTDSDLAVLLRRLRLRCESTASDFRAIGRDDLAGREEAQALILGDFEAATGVDTVTGDQLTSVIVGLLAELRAVTPKVDVGKALAALAEKLDGKAFEKKEAALKMVNLLGLEK